VSPQLRSTLDKLPGRFCRIALTFHMIEAAADAIARIQAGDHPDPVPRVLPVETARRVANYVRDILVPHLLRADRSMFSTIQTEHARRIAGFIALRQEDEIHMRDIVRYYKPLRAPEHARERDSIMDAFVIAAWLEPVPSTNPARPPTRWRVNPQVHDRFTALAETEAQRREKAREAVEALATRVTNAV